jgi:hypothetical protein
MSRKPTLRHDNLYSSHLHFENTSSTVAQKLSIIASIISINAGPNIREISVFEGT